MRFLSFHLDFFWYKVTQRGRSKVFEDVSENLVESRIEDVIAFFLSVDKEDEEKENIIDKTVDEMESILKQLKVTNIVLIPFAHLFGELSSPRFALETLKKLHLILTNKGYTTIRLPFGWFHELEMKAKGHPLSRVSRIIN